MERRVEMGWGMWQGSSVEETWGQQREIRRGGERAGGHLLLYGGCLRGSVDCGSLFELRQISVPSFSGIALRHPLCLFGQASGPRSVPSGRTLTRSRGQRAHKRRGFFPTTSSSAPSPFRRSKLLHSSPYHSPISPAPHPTTVARRISCTVKQYQTSLSPFQSMLTRTANDKKR